MPMLIVAGTIEAFVSPTGLAIPLKFAMSGALLVLLNVHLFGAGKGVRAAKRRKSAAHGVKPWAQCRSQHT